MVGSFQSSFLGWYIGWRHVFAIPQRRPGDTFAKQEKDYFSSCVSASTLWKINKPVTQIPQYTRISHNTDFGTEMCTFLSWCGVLWDMGQVHIRICVWFVGLRRASILGWSFIPNTRAMAKSSYRGDSRGKMTCQGQSLRAETSTKIWMSGLNYWLRLGTGRCFTKQQMFPY